VGFSGVVSVVGSCDASSCWGVASGEEVIASFYDPGLGVGSARFRGRAWPRIARRIARRITSWTARRIARRAVVGGDSDVAGP
jgi:hypothetical protein